MGFEKEGSANNFGIRALAPKSGFFKITCKMCFTGNFTRMGSLKNLKKQPIHLRMLKKMKILGVRLEGFTSRCTILLLC